VEVLTVIAAALAFAGGEAANTVVGEGVKDAYRTVKEFLSGKYPQVDLAPVGKAPQPKPRQEVLIEDLTNSGAAADAEFSPLAKRLVDAVAAEVRKAGAQTGVQLREFEAALVAKRLLLTTSTDEATRAYHFNDLSVRLGAAGDGVGALAAIREAVEIRADWRSRTTRRALQRSRSLGGSRKG
jgi:hypothetical protein